MGILIVIKFNRFEFNSIRVILSIELIIKLKFNSKVDGNGNAIPIGD